MPQELIDDLEAKPLSDSDIRRMIGPGPKIIPYNKIKRYSTIQQLVGPVGAVILYAQTPTYGHWVTVTRGPGPKEISYFDSYGYGVDVPLTWLDHQTMVDLGQGSPTLSKLLEKGLANGSIDKVDVNKVKLQKKGDDIASCGRYAALRIMFSKLSNQEFAKLISDKAGGGSAADRNVSLMTALL